MSDWMGDVKTDGSEIEKMPPDYAVWLKEIKKRIFTAQQKAAKVVNQELVLLYWQIGKDILERQDKQGWGAKVIERLARDLRTAFPEMKGFSRANLLYMRAFAEAWPDIVIVQQVVGQLPWGHNLVLLSKMKDQTSRLAYAHAAMKYGWSRNVLVMQIESGFIDRQGKALTNFDISLPQPQSDLAREALKDPYKLDFLGLGNEAYEREIEQALVKHITDFLLELGAGFAYVGRQVCIEVGGSDFFIDLLFYHVKLHCYIVIELKAGEFKPEHLGQLGFYLTAVDKQIKQPQDAPTIGLLLCKSKNKIVAEYALHNNTQPIGISEYELIKSLPKELSTELPSIEQIENEMEMREKGKGQL